MGQDFYKKNCTPTIVGFELGLFEHADNYSTSTALYSETDMILS